MTRPCALVVDGGAALREDLAAGLGVVPVRIHIGGTEILDSGDAESYHSFYDRLRAGEVAQTSTPAPGEYLEAFQRMQAEHVVCLTIPARWSGMYDAACLAAGMLEQEEGVRRVTVVETQSAAVGLALVARRSAQVCEADEPPEAVIAEARRAGSEVRMFGSLATLTYVARSGRVPALVAGISNTLHIRPVFRMHGLDTGRVALARTASGAIEALHKVAVEQLEGRQHWLLVFHADAPGEAAALGDRLGSLTGTAWCETAPLSPIAGAYTGPGAFGFAALPIPG